MLTGLIDQIRELLNAIGFNLENEEGQEIIFFVLATLLTSLVTGLVRLGRWAIRRRQQNIVKRDLHPFFTQTDLRKATQYYVPTHFQSNPPSQHSELIQTHKVTARQRLLPFFLKRVFKSDLNEQRFYMILAGSGMGKTTFMINLFVRYLSQPSWKKAPYHIKLMPLGYDRLLERIEALPDKENTLLLLDGLDEDTQAVKNHKKRLNQILKRVRDFRVVVFTCRTQFFSSEEEEPRETGIVRFGSGQGFQTFAKLYLSPFNEKDIRRYLHRKYGWWGWSKKRKAMRIINQSPNLMVRPMILSYMDDLLEEVIAYDYTSHLYQVLIQKWIAREGRRVGEDRRPEFQQELYRFSREVALNIYQNRKHRNGLFIGEKEIQQLAERHKFKLDEIEMKSRSLLNRNVLGQYKFAHKSILEYFLAFEAVENPGFATQFSFEGMDQARVFYDELCMSRHTLPFFKAANSQGKFRLDQGEWRELASARPKELRQISELEFDQLAQLEALAPLKKLRYLNLDGTQVRDLSPLQGLRNLAHLSLNQTDVSILQPLAEWGQLEELHLDGTRIRDLNPLRQMRLMQKLHVSNTVVGDLNPLSGMNELRVLTCHHTKVRDLSPLRRLDKLQVLELHNTAIHALGPLRELVNVKSLSLGYTKVESLSAIRHLKSLRQLSLNHTQVSSLKPLRELNQLRSLVMDHCPIQDLSSLEGMVHLERLSLINTPISDLSSLTAFQHLQELKIRRCPIKDISPIKSLTQLLYLEVSTGHFSPQQLSGLRAVLPHCEVVEKQRVAPL